MQAVTLKSPDLDGILPDFQKITTTNISQIKNRNKENTSKCFVLFLYH